MLSKRELERLRCHYYSESAARQLEDNRLWERIRLLEEHLGIEFVVTPEKGKYRGVKSATDSATNALKRGV